MIPAPAFHIAFPLSDAPTGGGNQFLRALKAEFVLRGLYSEDGSKAAVVLYNSYQNVPAAIGLRRANPDAIFIHRVDGPMRLYNRNDDPRDRLAMEANALIADATVFQTAWCRAANVELGWPVSGPEAVIGNAADPGVFRRRQSRPLGERVRIIATSWSANPNKGYDAYGWLDANLDAGKYEMTFVGNAPHGFSRIRSTGPLDSAKLASELAGHDVFVTASRKDPCSNSLIEALTVGLPAVARADGGHPELVGSGGLLFEEHTEIPSALAAIVARYDEFQRAIRVPTISEICDSYADFARDLIRARQGGSLKPRLPGAVSTLVARWRFRGR